MITLFHDHLSPPISRSLPCPSPLCLFHTKPQVSFSILNITLHFLHFVTGLIGDVLITHLLQVKQFHTAALLFGELVHAGFHQHEAVFLCRIKITITLVLTRSLRGRLHRPAIRVIQTQGYPTAGLSQFHEAEITSQGVQPGLKMCDFVLAQLHYQGFENFHHGIFAPLLILKIP